jgi:hypothetical protein
VAVTFSLGQAALVSRIDRSSSTPCESNDARRTAGNPDVLYEGHYRTVKKAECPQTRPAVVMDGIDAGKVLHVCRDENCSVHARVSNYQPTLRERSARAKELLAERVEKESRVRILNAVRKKLPKTLSRPDLEMAVLDYFERVGHDNHRRLCRVYGWEEKKATLRGVAARSTTRPSPEKPCLE